MRAGWVSSPPSPARFVCKRVDRCCGTECVPLTTLCHGYGSQGSSAPPRTRPRVCPSGRWNRRKCCLTARKTHDYRGAIPLVPLLVDFRLQALCAGGRPKPHGTKKSRYLGCHPGACRQHSIRCRGSGDRWHSSRHPARLAAPVQTFRPTDGVMRHAGAERYRLGRNHRTGTGLAGRPGTISEILRATPRTRPGTDPRRSLKCSTTST